MKKSLLISVFATLAMMISLNALAQEKATGKAYKAIQKDEKVINKDLQKKAIKEARKQAKELTKEGFKTPVGKLPLDKQLENSWEKQMEIDMNGNPYWYIATSRVIGGNQSAAAMQATNTVQTKVTQLIESKVANDDMGQEEAASLSSAVAAGKSIISGTLGRTIPLVEVYRTLPNKNVEVMVTIGYSLEAANKVAVKALSEELAKKSPELAKELDKLAQ
jgi:ribosomal protein L31E